MTIRSTTCEKIKTKQLYVVQLVATNDSDAAYKYNEISCYNGFIIIAFLNYDLYFIIRCLQQVRRKVPSCLRHVGQAFWSASAVMIGQVWSDRAHGQERSAVIGRRSNQQLLTHFIINYFIHMIYKSHSEFRIMFCRLMIKSYHPQECHKTVSTINVKYYSCYSHQNYYYQTPHCSLLVIIIINWPLGCCVSIYINK
jgi:hypothetical protein